MIKASEAVDMKEIRCIYLHYMLKLNEYYWQGYASSLSFLVGDGETRPEKWHPSLVTAQLSGCAASRHKTGPPQEGCLFLWDTVPFLTNPHRTFYSQKFIRPRPRLVIWFVVGFLYLMEQTISGVLFCCVEISPGCLIDFAAHNQIGIRDALNEGGVSQE